MLPANDDSGTDGIRDGVQFTTEYNAACTDVEFVYVRGSGQVLGDTEEWRQFQREAKKLAERNGYTYKIYDLDYPAVAISQPSVAVGAFVSAGEAFKFGRSVDAGVNNLNQHRAVMDIHCPLTRWVLMGYSQGALVVMDALPKFNPETFAYAALLGDPKTYLPEGEGLYPMACAGGLPSPYRVFVPECRTHRGILGARKPYVPEGYEGKVGLWCNRDDIICGSTKNVFKMEGHSQYRDIGSIPWVLREAD